jgi:hypothetical protein
MVLGRGKLRVEGEGEEDKGRKTRATEGKVEGERLMEGGRPKRSQVGILEINRNG